MIETIHFIKHYFQKKSSLFKATYNLNQEIYKSDITLIYVKIVKVVPYHDVNLRGLRVLEYSILFTQNCNCDLLHVAGYCVSL